MAKKASGSKQSGSRGISPAAIIGVVVVVAAVGALIFWPAASTTDPSASTAADASGTPEPSPAIVAATQAKAAFGPHTQATYPPIPFQGYAPPRSEEVVRAAYQFAAEHPEITSYVPCFCGCERAGHQGNTDCFVKSRAANGDVTEWDEHGLDCAVCIDVATVARQMHTSGASVTQIRAAVDKQFGGVYPSRMPTPHPPAAHTAH